MSGLRGGIVLEKMYVLVTAFANGCKLELYGWRRAKVTLSVPYDGGKVGPRGGGAGALLIAILISRDMCM